MTVGLYTNSLLGIKFFFSVADKMNSSCHTILRQTAKLLILQNMTSFTETDNFVDCQGIIFLVWNPNSIAILAKNRYWFMLTNGEFIPHTHTHTHTHTHIPYLSDPLCNHPACGYMSKVICSLQIFRLGLFIYHNFQAFYMFGPL